MEITIRHAEPDDYEALHRIYTAPRVIEGTLQLPLQSAESRRKRLTEPPEGLYQLVAAVADDVVGDLGLHTTTRPRRRHVGEIGMGVRDDWQGKGVGSALLAAALDLADNWLNLARVELTVYIDNAAALALYRKFGFMIEGTHRDYAFRDGGFVDAYCMARLKPVAGAGLA